MLAQWDTRDLPAALLAPVRALIDRLAQMRPRKRMEDQKLRNSTVAIPRQVKDTGLAWTRALK